MATRNLAKIKELASFIYAQARSFTNISPVRIEVFALTVYSGGIAATQTLVRAMFSNLLKAIKALSSLIR